MNNYYLFSNKSYNNDYNMTVLCHFFLFKLSLNSHHLDNFTLSFIDYTSKPLEVNFEDRAFIDRVFDFLRPNDSLNPIEIRTNSSVYRGR